MKQDNITLEKLAQRDFDLHVRSSRPMIYIVSHEEQRVIDSIRSVAGMQNRMWDVVSWDINKGIEIISNFENNKINNGIMDQIGVLKWFEEQPSPLSKERGISQKYLILVLKDFHVFMGYNGSVGQIEEEVIRALYNIAERNITQHKVIVFISPVLYLPTRLERICAVIDYPLPERYHISKYFDGVIDLISGNKSLDKFKKDYSVDEKDAIISACQGLTQQEIELLVSYNINLSVNGGFDPVFIASKKRDIIRKAGIIDWVDTKSGLESVGGLHELKSWLFKRKRAFTEDAKEYGLENPKGLLLVGVQGAGKSLSATAIAKHWNLPLLRLDMGKIFAGIVGSSEANIRQAIKIAESVSPCILWIDEIDKGMSGFISSNATDGGTAARVFGFILTWMQEKTSPVYVVATANDISQLPPELLRKGRFDEIFFVDLPDEEDRKEIIKIHIEKRNRNISNFNLTRLARASELFTGAEIEAGIVSAMYEAFSRGDEFNTNDIINAFEDMFPIAKTMEREISALRNWAEHRARNASYKNTRRKDFASDNYDSKMAINTNIHIIDDENNETNNNLDELKDEL